LRHERDLPSLELVDRRQQLAERAAETVEAHNAERVSPARPLNRLPLMTSSKIRIVPAASRRWR
jgi:hypothetical protein